ncbi:MAG: ferredoxin [Treponema sp.]|nr:ferredoxin [Treponema sp.]
MGKNKFSVRGKQTFLNDKPVLIRGLRCSNGLYSEEAAAGLTENLEVYAAHGLNAVSVFFMGNRFGNVKGYRRDASLDPVYAQRMERIIQAADDLGMVVLVGCLYWEESQAKWTDWTQKEANLAVANTCAWLKDNDFRNVFIDVDNEGMARVRAGFDTRELILAAKSAGAGCPVASNYIGPAPEEADLCIHFSHFSKNKPYIETEGVPENAPGAYWNRYSKQDSEICNYGTSSYMNYINIGVYTPEMKEDQIKRSNTHFDRGDGYMLASTWLQAAAPLGPNHNPGGSGTQDSPGIAWWLEYTKNRFGPYTP